MTSICSSQVSINAHKSIKKTKCHNCNTHKGVYFTCKFCKQQSCSSCVQPEVHHCSQIHTVRENTKQENANALFKNAHKANKVVPL